MISNFSNKGYLIIRKAINPNLSKKIRSEIFKLLKINDKNERKKYINLCNKVTKLKSKDYHEYTKPLFNFLHHHGYLEKIFLEKKIHNSVSHLLGKDLAYCTDPGINLNVPISKGVKKGYQFKAWHQEIWSGASPSTIQLWTPLIHKNSRSGQIEFIIDSHKWGHVPHKNRMPIELPKNIKTKRLNLECGDVIIFSTLLIHRSVETDYPRMALPCLIKNFKNKEFSFETNRNFHIYSYSEMTKLERIWGNHYLSPFRIKDINEK